MDRHADNALRAANLGGVYVSIPTDEAGIQGTIKSYSRMFAGQMREQGFHVELEEVEGELGLVFAKARRDFCKQTGVKFGTYLHRAFVNRVKDMKKQMANCWGLRAVNLNGRHDAADPCCLETLAVNSQLVEKVGASLDDWQKTVFNELVSPSDAVIRTATALRRANCNGPHIQAICQVHGIPRTDVYYALKKIRRRIFLLTSDK